MLRKKLAKNETENDVNYKTLIIEADSLDRKLTQLSSSYAIQKKNLSITWDQVQANLNNDEAAIEFIRFKGELGTIDGHLNPDETH